MAAQLVGVAIGASRESAVVLKMSTGTSHLVSTKLNVAQVLAAAQTELLELFGSTDVKKVGGVDSE